MYVPTKGFWADAVGCSFLCAYCWNYDRNLHPDRYRTFYSPRDVASKLMNVADARSLDLYRVTGREPDSLLALAF